jgi:hypothetical protein
MAEGAGGGVTAGAAEGVATGGGASGAAAAGSGSFLLQARQSDTASVESAREPANLMAGEASRKLVEFSTGISRELGPKEKTR